MAKLSSIAKHKHLLRLIALKKERRTALKAIIRNMSLSEEERADARVALNKLPRNSSPVRNRNRCLLTGRSRGYLRKFKMSRICFRELARDGLVPGVFKASW